jgi:hypothetical protein
LEKKLLSPIKLLEFRAQQQEQIKSIALKLEESKIKESIKEKKVLSPKEVLDNSSIHSLEILNIEDDNFNEDVEEIEFESESDISDNLLDDEAYSDPNSIKEPKYYDNEILEINNVLSDLKKNIFQIPEIKYYDEEIQSINSKIDSLDIRYYENDLKEINQKLKNFQTTESQEVENIKSNLNKLFESFDKLHSFGVSESTKTNNYIQSIKDNFYQELNKIKEEISELPEIKNYDSQLLEIKEKIESVKGSIPDIPEIRYYDEDLNKLLQNIESVRSSIPSIPEIKYYDQDISDLKESIKNVENKIPTVPDIPEIKYYDQDIIDLKESIKSVEDKIPTVPDIPEIKYYDQDISSLEEQIKVLESKISEIPEVKYYDDDLTDVTKNILDLEKSIVKLGEHISEVKKTFNEKEEPKDWSDEINQIYEEIERLKKLPVVTESSDPLIPLDQNFATLDDLQNHYKLFINRIQQQLSSLGGGGETRLKYLDDVDVSNLNDGYLMIWNAATSKFVFVSPQTIGVEIGSNTDANPDPNIDDYGTY